jgi:hypothetical protein
MVERDFLCGMMDTLRFKKDTPDIRLRYLFFYADGGAQNVQWTFALRRP